MKVLVQPRNGQVVTVLDGNLVLVARCDKGMDVDMEPGCYSLEVSNVSPKGHLIYPPVAEIILCIKLPPTEPAESPGE